MSERTITDFLKDILENIHNAVEFIGTMTFEPRNGSLSAEHADGRR